MAKSTHDNLIRTGLKLFYQHGFNAVGLDRILKQVGVTKTTFYNHFDSKEQFIRDVIEVHVDEQRAHFREGVDRLGGDDPQQRLLAIFDVLHELFTSNSFRGCLLINALVEFPEPHDHIHELALKNRRVLFELFMELSAAAGVRDPSLFAAQFSMIYDGAILARQTMLNLDAAIQARRLAGLLLEASR